MRNITATNSLTFLSNLVLVFDNKLANCNELQCFQKYFDIYNCLWTWDLIVSVPDHCLLFYFKKSYIVAKYDIRHLMHYCYIDYKNIDFFLYSPIFLFLLGACDKSFKI